MIEQLRQELVESRNAAAEADKRATLAEQKGAFETKPVENLSSN
jgi:hypothetical protein